MSDSLGGDRAGRTGTVFNDELLFESIAQALAGEPRQIVDIPAGRETDQHPHGP